MKGIKNFQKNVKEHYSLTDALLILLGIILLVALYSYGIISFDIVSIVEYKAAMQKYNVTVNSNSTILITSSELAKGARLSITDMASSVVVIEFTDFECPYCKSSDEQILKAKQKLALSNVSFVIRHVPQPRIHPNSQVAAITYECYLSKMKNVNSDLLATQLYNSDLSKSSLSQIGTTVGLSLTESLACQVDPKAKAIVESDISFSKKVGVDGTPTFLIISPQKPNIYQVITGGLLASDLVSKIETVMEKANAK